MNQDNNLDSNPSLARPIKPTAWWRSVDKKVIILVVLLILILAGVAVWLLSINNNKPLSDGEHSLSDTEISSEMGRQLDTKKADELAQQTPTADAPIEEKTGHYHELLSVIHDTARLISVYETAKQQDILLPPGLAVKVAQAYLDRNLESDKESARQVFEMARRYISNLPFRGGDGGTNEILADIDYTQREMGL